MQHLQMERSLKLNFPNGSTAKVAQVQDEAQLPVALREMGLRGSRPVLVVIGGASQLSDSDLAQVRSLFSEVLAPLAESLELTVVDGGTDAGVMRLMGQARETIKGTFPLIGVAPIGLAQFPANAAASPEAVPLEPHHTHFVLIPGSTWGDESPWLAYIATLLAGDAPSVVVLVNGGEITWEDALQNAREDRPLVVVAGSGRAADILATALRSGETRDERVKELMASAQLDVIDLTRSFETAAALLTEILSKR